MSDSWWLRYPGTDLEFGGLDSPYPFNEAPDIGAYTITDEDSDLPRVDGRAFGADYHGATVVTLDLDVGGDSLVNVRRSAGQLRQAWRGDSIRTSPGALAELVSDFDRTAFGRPRQITVDHDTDYAGVMGALVTFVTVDPLWYGLEQSAEVALAPTIEGGLEAPLVAPLTLASEVVSEGIVRVGGEVSTPIRLTIHGPIVNPVATLGPLTFELLGALAYDESVTISSWPWRRTVLNGLGGSAATMLSRRSTLLTEARLEPGAHAFALRGQSDLGTARASLSWRDAFTTP